MNTAKRIAIFASGSGSNAENIASFFKDKESAVVALMLTNNPNALVIDRAKRMGIPCTVFNRAEFFDDRVIVDLLIAQKIDLIVLAGFLWKIPENLLQHFAGKIINIHPALLPKYGGKGMYGHHVHKAVIEHGEKESGITIHYVNEKYDEGKVIFQASCLVSREETPESLAAKIQQLEHTHFPRVIADLLE